MGISINSMKNSSTLITFVILLFCYFNVNKTYGQSKPYLSNLTCTNHNGIIACENSSEKVYALDGDATKEKIDLFATSYLRNDIVLSIAKRLYNKKTLTKNEKDIFTDFFMKKYVIFYAEHDHKRMHKKAMNDSVKTNFVKIEDRLDSLHKDFDIFFPTIKKEFEKFREDLRLNKLHPTKYYQSIGIIDEDSLKYKGEGQSM